MGLVWERTRCPTPPAMRVFLVEHRTDTDITELGRVETWVPHASALDPWASHLRRSGIIGELRLVEICTGLLVARQDLAVRRPPAAGAMRPVVATKRTAVGGDRVTR